MHSKTADIIIICNCPKKKKGKPQTGRKSDKGLASRLYKEHLQLDNEKTNNLILKMGKGFEQILHKRRY
jgi:hypothetical protein